MTTSNHDLNNVKHRFLFLANEQGIKAAEREILAGLDPLNPKTQGLRRALLTDLQQDERGQWFYPNRDA